MTPLATRILLGLALLAPPAAAFQAARPAASGCSTGGCHVHARDPHPMDEGRGLPLSCVACHGGDDQATTKEQAHPRPRHPDQWPAGGRNPERSNALLNDEDPAWIQFVNPGDLRVADQTCGGAGNCHTETVHNVRKSLMTTSAHFWGTAAYSNGIVPLKRTFFGESYARDGRPQQIQMNGTFTQQEIEQYSLTNALGTGRPLILPMPNFEISQTGNIFRVFERGSRLGGAALGFNGLPLPTIGLPDKLEDPGRPNNRLSDRGLGTLVRVDLPLLNVHKTRLNDPHLSFLGTNDNPGDYRSGGCTACHVVYANDRDWYHSGPDAVHGHRGHTQSDDPTMPRKEPGHPIRHAFTKGIPSSQCMVCHMHQPNAFLNPYYGFQMWTYETDGDQMWPKAQQYPTHEEMYQRLSRNPEEAATRGNWGDPEFLAKVAELNPSLKHTQFADYHGHGWVFRGVFKTDRKGNLLNAMDEVIPYATPDKFKGSVPLAPNDPDPFAGGKVTQRSAEDQQKLAVHLKDIHAERGMHCVDCHFNADAHGNGNLYAEYQAAISITCKDCHGTVQRKARLSYTGPAAAGSGESFASGRTTPWRQPVFDQGAGGSILQRSMVHKDMVWTVPQIADRLDYQKDSKSYRAARAHSLRRDGETFGRFQPNERAELAHGDDKMECYSCHSSWVTACFGCHLPQKANWKSPERHFGGTTTRNWASYNPQVARDDAFLLGVAPDVKGNKLAPVRSSSAVLISSEDAQRQKIYPQIPTIAGNGMSSQAFNTHFPHTVRTRETRNCEDCHVAEDENNNAWLAQTYLLGTNYVNFIGYHAFVGCGSGGFDAVRVTEWDEPQAVIGSYLHRLAYPDWYAAHERSGRVLKDAVHHSGSDIRSLQLRGEYLYTASGEGGFRVYDVANVANKGFSEKVVTAPVSPLGQDTHVAMTFATAVALPTNNLTTMSREYRPENKEQRYQYQGRAQNLHESYRYAYVTDRHDGLHVVDVDCLTDGDPQNNFIERVATFAGDKVSLTGAENLAVAGTTVLVCCTAGLVAVNIEDPRAPAYLTHLGAPEIGAARAVAVQFRYAFVIDDKGLVVVDITIPKFMKVVARLDLPEARDIYVARNWGYVAAGPRGMVILDLEKPLAPRELLTFTDEGRINDLNQVKVGMTNDSVFAYLADGRNGLKVLQLVSPEDQDRSAYGFAPDPRPRVVATWPTGAPALAVSKGLDRDRAVDEAGNQMAVFGRIGGRPMTLQEMRRLYLRDGQVYKVRNTPKDK